MYRTPDTVEHPHLVNPDTAAMPEKSSFHHDAVAAHGSTERLTDAFLVPKMQEVFPSAALTFHLFVSA